MFNEFYNIKIAQEKKDLVSATTSRKKANKNAIQDKALHYISLIYIDCSKYFIFLFTADFSLFLVK